MYRGKTVGVVVPAYNEEEFIYEVLETVPEFVDRVYIVDDSSTDNTWDVIQSFVHQESVHWSADDPSEPQSRIVPIRHEKNRGVGGAIKTGYLRALRDGLDVVAVMNGDGQMDPAILDRILTPVIEGEADYAKGDRLSRSEHRRSMPPLRLFGNVVLTIMTRVASGYQDLVDSQNGYTAISSRALAALQIEDLYEGYGFLNDVLIRLNACDMDIVDVQMPAVYGEEQSGIRYASFIPRMTTLLIRGFCWRVTYKWSTAFRNRVVGTLETVFQKNRWLSRGEATADRDGGRTGELDRTRPGDRGVSADLENRVSERRPVSRSTDPHWETNGGEE